MDTKNKNLIIAILLIATVVFGFMWYSESNKLTTSVPSTQTTIAQEDLSVEDWESDPYSWQKLKCTPTTKISCDRTSCEQDNPSVWVELDRRAKTFSRSDVKGCDSYKADFETAGAFTNIQGVSPMGTMIKVLGDRKYIEVATIGLSSLISSGVCVATP